MGNRTLALVGVGAVAVGSALWGAGPAIAAPGAAAPVVATGWLATLHPIAANKAKGSGTGWITLVGNSAEFTVQISGVVKAPHPSLIFVDGQGKCPTTAQATSQNGHSAVSATDGMPLYGSTIGAALTTSGGTSANSATDMAKFPSGNDYTYQRKFNLSADTVKNLKNGTAVMVVHGIDYNGNGKYDNVLGASDIVPSLPAEATDPALCGAFVAAQMPAVPLGSADTGGGSAAAATHPAELGLGGAALVAALVAGSVGYRRRRSAQN